MKLFLDTADLALIHKYAEYGLVDGVTTNPSIIAKEGTNLESRIREIAEIIPGPVSCEVTTLTAEEMIAQGRMSNFLLCPKDSKHSRCSPRKGFLPI
jgi:transaldolase